jgi:hypothetical protein
MQIFLPIWQHGMIPNSWRPSSFPQGMSGRGELLTPVEPGWRGHVITIADLATYWFLMPLL